MLESNTSRMATTVRIRIFARPLVETQNTRDSQRRLMPNSVKTTPILCPWRERRLMAHSICRTRAESSSGAARGRLLAPSLKRAMHTESRCDSEGVSRDQIAYLFAVIITRTSLLSRDGSYSPIGTPLLKEHSRNAFVCVLFARWNVL